MATMSMSQKIYRAALQILVNLGWRRHWHPRFGWILKKGQDPLPQMDPEENENDC